MVHCCPLLVHSSVFDVAMQNYYNTSPDADRVKRVKDEINQVRDIMISNIDKVLDRGDKIEVLVQVFSYPPLRRSCPRAPRSTPYAVLLFFVGPRSRRRPIACRLTRIRSKQSPPS